MRNEMKKHQQQQQQPAAAAAASTSRARDKLCLVVAVGSRRTRNTLEHTLAQENSGRGLVSLAFSSATTFGRQGRRHTTQQREHDLSYQIKTGFIMPPIVPVVTKTLSKTRRHGGGCLFLTLCHSATACQHNSSNTSSTAVQQYQHHHHGPRGHRSVLGGQSG